MGMARYAIVAIAAAVLGATAIKAIEPENPVAVAQQAIWAKEMSIYAGRAQGQVDFYVNNASPHYLAWPAGTPAPFPLAKLQQGAAAMKGHAREHIDTQLKGFTVSGTTAVIYYLNHRTMMPDGTPVDQYYANIHVWVNEGGDWKVLGSMSRLTPPPSS